MKAMMLLTGGGCLVILTTLDKPTDPQLLQKLAEKGIEKFVAFEIPLALAERRYGGHFTVVSHNLYETDGLRVLDYNRDRAFNLFRFDEVGPAVVWEGPETGAPVSAVA